MNDLFSAILTKCFGARISASTCIAIMMVGAAPIAVGADLTQFSAPASGSDMWNGAMGRYGMYTPHPNTCNGSTEVFVSVSTAPDGVSLGFCMDKDQQTATTWIAARHACLSSTKRLPEPGEFQYACVNSSGLNDMTDNWEWSTNFPVNVVEDPLNVREGVAATAVGFGSCTKAGTGWVANSDDTPSSFAYRCVH